jgi:hypothetical protein
MPPDRIEHHGGIAKHRLVLEPQCNRKRMCFTPHPALRATFSLKGRRKSHDAVLTIRRSIVGFSGKTPASSISSPFLDPIFPPQEAAGP